MATNTSPFSAADSALGYMYQVRCALLWSLERLKTESRFEVSLETLDDVTFEADGIPKTLLQTKHHVDRAANLTDASTDIWGTLRSWISARKTSGAADDAVLYLLTTQNTAVGTAAAYLKIDGRDIEAASAALDATARSSTNEQNKKAYAEFLDLNTAQKRSFLNQIVVIDAAPSIIELDDLLQAEIFYACERKHQAAFLDYLEGWWYRRVVVQLSSKLLVDRIISEELESQMNDLRDQFKQDSLPISDDLLEFMLTADIEAALLNFTFVHQINLAQANSKRITAAIRDYYRAFEQRSRWIRDELLLVGNLTVYEKNRTYAYGT